MFAVAMAVVAAVGWTAATRLADGRYGSVSDTYHNAVTVFLVAYLVVPSLAYALACGSAFSRASAAAILLWYLWTVFHDKGSLRSEQRQYALLCGGLDRLVRSLIPAAREIRDNMDVGKSPIDRPWWKSKDRDECRRSMTGLAATLREAADELEGAANSQASLDTES
jgi:hypothetical protein